MKKEQFKNGLPCNVLGDKCSYTELISQERDICFANEGRYPDNVMIHPIHKGNIYHEATISANHTIGSGFVSKCFGMKIIWTTDIQELEIICTYNGR